MRSADGSTIATQANGTTVLRSPSGATVTVHAPDASGRSRLVMRSATGATFSFADARAVPGMNRFPFVAGPRPRPMPTASTRAPSTARSR